MSKRAYLGLGLGAVLLAVVINPLLAAAGVLQFALGSALAVVAPSIFGAIALVAGIDLYRGSHHRRGLGVAITSITAVLVGIALGFGAVF